MHLKCMRYAAMGRIYLSHNRESENSPKHVNDSNYRGIS
jgi:hypothetical protein